MTLPDCAYDSKEALQNGIRENKAYCAEMLGDYAYELVDIVLNTHGAEALVDEVRAWEDGHIKRHAEYLWTTQPHNYRASASELRDRALANRCDSERMAA